MIEFDLPKEYSSIIKVIGVGGGGSNAVDYMFTQNIKGVDFVICNTDAQHISTSKVPNKIQLGPQLTLGLGAGANPEIGRQATEESSEELRRILEVNTKMVFITAGMGGGTGTGGAPIVAKICKDLGILTIGIITTPFSHEGPKRIKQAEEGVNKLKEYVDTLLVVSNDKLRHQFGNLKFREAFAKADNVLATAAKCITDVITTTGQINVDFADVCTVMRNGGVAILGNGSANGENRAQIAIHDALNSPLLNDNDISGARWILINISSGEGDFEFTMDEVEIIQQLLRAQTGPDTDIILGMGFDESLHDKINITLIATGFEHKNPFQELTTSDTLMATKDDKIIMALHQPLPANVQQANLQPTITETVVAIDPLAPILMDAGDISPITTVLPTAIPTQTQPLQGNSMIEKNITAAHQQSHPQNQPIQLITEKKVENNYLNPIQSLYLHTSLPSENQTLNNQTDHHKKADNTSAQSVHLAKPSKILQDDQKFLKSNGVKSSESHVNQCNDNDRPIFDLQLVIKETNATDNPGTPSTPVPKGPVEEPAMQDEAETLKRKAAERQSMLRNLSFNNNAANPNSEYDTVPAYVRRNLSLDNSSHQHVERFYSNMTVKADESNTIHFSTINAFFEGNRPD
jgi:cell division protein FtsZ